MPRQAEHPIHDQFIARWSPRAFDASEMPEADLLTLFEAARWAPSSMNYQPWRFVYARRGDPEWETFLGPLLPFNRDWARNASALVYILSEMTMDRGKPGDPSPSHTHSFDAGAAWMSVALQAQHLGYHTHGMAGVDWNAAKEVLNVPDGLRLEAAIAVGTIAPAETLPDALRGRELPSSRRPISETVVRGRFPG